MTGISKQQEHHLVTSALRDLALLDETDLRRLMAAGTCQQVADPDVFISDCPKDRVVARAACWACPIQHVCLEQTLRSETTVGQNGRLPKLDKHSSIAYAGLDPEERQPLQTARRDCHTPETRATAAQALAQHRIVRDLVAGAGAVSRTQTGEGVDDTASRRSHGHHDTETEEEAA